MLNKGRNKSGHMSKKYIFMVVKKTKQTMGNAKWMDTSNEAIIWKVFHTYIFP
jgi:hypothetical protein